MVKRITISIPDDLAQELEAKKDAIPNISKVCADALRKELAVKTEAKEGVRSLSNVIERLRAERYEAVERWPQQGFKDGRRWAMDAHYKDLKWVVQYGPSMDRTDFWDFIRDLCNRSPAAMALWEWIGTQVKDDDARTVANRQYWDAFFVGVRDLWKSIANDVENNTTEEQRDHGQAEEEY